MVNHGRLNVYIINGITGEESEGHKKKTVTVTEY